METKVIPTAKEFLKEKGKGATIFTKSELVNMLNEYSVLKTRFHVEAALKAASKVIKDQLWIDNFINLKDKKCQKSILSAYPLDKIV